jgi:tetratricopeptide (TPR) repeat protein
MAHFIGTLMGFDFSDSPHLAAALADAHAFHQQAQHHLMQFVLHVARQSPVVIELADIHWADDSSLDAVNGLVRWNPEWPLLVVSLARPELYRRRPDWGSGQPFHTRLDLRPLSRRESRRLVAEILQKVEEVPTALRDLVVDRAEGNPFYIEELIKVLIEDRVIVKEEPTWRVEAERLSGVRVPSTLTGLVQVRLDGLFPAERTVLQRAAIIGRIFWDDAVRALEDADAFRVDVPSTLQGLTERDLVHIRAESAFAGAQEYILARNTVRDVVLESILGRQGRAYHDLAAKWLIERSSERIDEYAGAIADHLERAGKAERAIPYLRRAGERAAAQYANSEAVDYLSRALDLAPEEDLNVRCTLLLTREQVYDVQGAREAQDRDLKALRELSEGLADDRLRAEVAQRQASYANRTDDFPAAIVAAQRAIRLARSAGDLGNEAKGYREWGRALRSQGDYETARSQFERALVTIRASGVRQVEADVLRRLGNLSIDQGDYAGAQACFEQARNLWREVGGRMGEWLGLVAFAELSLAQGDYAQANAYSQQGLRFRDEIDPDYFGFGLLHHGQLLSAQGDYAGARPHYEQALRMSRDVEDQSSEAWALASLCLLSHHLRDDEAALERGQQALLIAQGTGSHPRQAMALLNLGHALAALGRLAEAADVYRQALAIRRELSQPHLAVEPLAGLARLALAQGERTQALARVEEILDYLEAHLTLDGTFEPLQVYLTCYRVLRANEDARSGEILDAAYHLLQERANKIEDKDLRRSYLENVAAHQEIVAVWNEEEQR